MLRENPACRIEGPLRIPRATLKGRWATTFRAHLSAELKRAGITAYQIKRVDSMTRETIGGFDDPRDHW